MFLMSTLIVLPPNPIRFIGGDLPGEHHRFPSFSRWRRGRHLLRLVARAGNGGERSRERPWWERLFLEGDRAAEEGSDLEVRPEDLLGDLYVEEEGEEEADGESSAEERKFEAWRRRAEAITEVWEAREDARNEESRAWEDWLGEGGVGDSSGEEWTDGGSGGPIVPPPEEGLVRSIRELVLRQTDDDLLFEDRVFKYASTNSAKFLVILVLVPWVLDFVVHDFALMPFLDRYVEKVPLAAEFLDVRRDQKLEMIKVMKLEQARYRFEAEIGKAPPLSDDEVWLEIRHKLIEQRDEWRLENRKAFANIWSDMVYGITLFLLIYFNPRQVTLLKFTGYKLLNNISDTGKAFLIILVTDIFLGYHSEAGWHAMMEAIVEHYGLEVDQAAITIFVCFVPVVIDACVKLWLFKFLPRLSPNVTNIFREMMRH